MAAFTARGGVEFDIFDTLIEVGGGGAITALQLEYNSVLVLKMVNFIKVVIELLILGLILLD